MKVTVEKALMIKQEFEFMAEDLERIEKGNDLELLDSVLLNDYARRCRKFAKQIYDSIKDANVEL